MPDRIPLDEFTIEAKGEVLPPPGFVMPASEAPEDEAATDDEE